jgi:uncharacterized protein with von Willebrand factor type A (vWA) domain
MNDRTLIDELTGFARALRDAGISVDTARVAASVAAVAELRPLRRSELYWAARLSLCSRPSDLPVFDAAFAAWFGAPGAASADPEPTESKTIGTAAPSEQADGATMGGAEDAPLAAAWEERVAHRGVHAVTAKDRAELEALIPVLTPCGATRRSMHRRAGGRGYIDVRRTVENIRRSAGEVVQIRYQERVRKPRRLVLLLDVSQSMAGHADALLRFAHACVGARPATAEVFTIGTRLTRITAALKLYDLDELAARAVGEFIPDWGGGTRIGETLREYLQSWGQRSIARSAITVVASDGWDSSTPAYLEEQTARLRRTAYRLIWVHPQSGRRGYTPRGGMKVIAPHVDELVNGNGYLGLRRLAELIARS